MPYTQTDLYAGNLNNIVALILLAFSLPSWPKSCSHSISIINDDRIYGLGVGTVDTAARRLFGADIYQPNSNLQRRSKSDRGHRFIAKLVDTYPVWNNLGRFWRVWDLLSFVEKSLRNPKRSTWRASVVGWGTLHGRRRSKTQVRGRRLSI